MKNLFFLLLLFPLSSFAFNVCDTFFVQTYDVIKALEKRNSQPMSADILNLSSENKKLIYQTLNLWPWEHDLSEAELLKSFQSLQEGRISIISGSIETFKVDGLTIVLVRYYPGYKEYGAFWWKAGNQFILITKIEDSYLMCE